jgi:hypothetical protein
MRTRLAVKAPPPYDAVRNNFRWPDHAARTLTTASLISWLQPNTVCDPACGDASILETAHRLAPIHHAYLADLSAPQIAALRPSFPHETWVGDLHGQLDRLPVVDLILLTEVLEHLEDPDEALRHARRKGVHLIASSPIGDPEMGRNHEHLWAWDTDGYGEMLRDTGWEPIATATLTFPSISGNSQIWVAQ